MYVEVVLIPHSTPHWWTSEPRNEARYEPGLVYEARTPEGGLRGSYQGSYEARISLVYEARTAAFAYEARIRGSYSHLRGSYTSLIIRPVYASHRLLLEWT